MGQLPLAAPTGHHAAALTCAACSTCQVAGVRVRKVHCTYASGSHEIELARVDDGPQPLAAVLGALSCPGSRLHSLTLHNSQLALPRLACGPHLAALAQLHLDECYEDGGVEAALEALLMQARRCCGWVGALRWRVARRCRRRCCMRL